MDPLNLVEIFDKIGELLGKLHQNKTWSVTKDDLLEMVVIQKAALQCDAIPEKKVQVKCEFECPTLLELSNFKVETDDDIQLAEDEASDQNDIASSDNRMDQEVKGSLGSQIYRTRSGRETLNGGVDFDIVGGDLSGSPKSKKKGQKRKLCSKVNNCMTQKQKKRCSEDPDFDPLTPHKKENPKKPLERKSRKYPGLKKNQDGIWQCPLCPTAYKCHKSASKHYMRHHDSKFLCETCPMKFKLQKDYNFHKDYMHNDGSGKYVCQKCGMKFNMERSCRYHYHAVHSERDAKGKERKNGISCHFCMKKFSHPLEKQLHSLQFHGNDLLYCSICTKPHDSETVLISHMNNKHKASPALLHCEFCNKQFILEDSLAYHHDDKHEDKKNNVEKPFICQVDSCQKRFQKELFLKQHANFHERIPVKKTPTSEEESSPCETCGLSIPSKKMSEHLKKHGEKSTFTCEDCGKGFVTTAKLKYHRLDKHVKRELKCPIESCQKVFYRRDILSYHLRAVHTNREQHQCDKCDKCFAHKSDLAVHKKGVHQGLKSFCSFCEKEFLRTSEKNRHEKQVHKMNY